MSILRNHETGGWVVRGFRKSITFDYTKKQYPNSLIQMLGHEIFFIHNSIISGNFVKKYD